MYLHLPCRLRTKLQALYRCSAFLFHVNLWSRQAKNFEIYFFNVFFLVEDSATMSITDFWVFEAEKWNFSNGFINFPLNLAICRSFWRKKIFLQSLKVELEFCFWYLTVSQIHRMWHITVFSLELFFFVDQFYSIYMR